MAEQEKNQAGGDIDRLLAMLCRKFPMRFAVERGGVILSLQITEENLIHLHRNGGWDYE